MSREKQIEEMAETLAEMCDLDLLADCEEKECSKCMATAVYNAGYRKQSVGEWTERIEPLPWCEDDVEIFYECSCCGTHNFGKSPYCPNCGARMKGV